MHKRSFTFSYAINEYPPSGVLDDYKPPTAFCGGMKRDKWITPDIFYPV